MMFKHAWIMLFLTAASSAAGLNPCQKDADRFCKEVIASHGNISRCLKQHDAELSPACKAKHEESKKRMQATRNACLGDMNKFCKSAKGARGGIMGCLSQHESNLSIPCKSARASMRSRVRMLPATPSAP